MYKKKHCYFLQCFQWCACRDSNPYPRFGMLYPIELPGLYIWTSKNKKVSVSADLCELVGSRTPNLLIRSQMLYPIELRVHNFIKTYNFLHPCSGVEPKEHPEPLDQDVLWTANLRNILK